jgi:regulator of cell morphogenesis and NO signaling
MPRPLALVERVDGVHGDRHPELSLVHLAYRQALEEIEPHLTTEERVVFPAISRLEKSQTPVQSCFGSLDDQLSELLTEHGVVGELFREVRALTDGYAGPTDACNSYRAMLTGLKKMELDLPEHIPKENNIPLPKVIELEQRLAGR